MGHYIEAAFWFAVGIVLLLVFPQFIPPIDTDSLQAAYSPGITTDLSFLVLKVVIHLMPFLPSVICLAWAIGKVRDGIAKERKRATWPR